LRKLKPNLTGIIKFIAFEKMIGQKEIFLRQRWNYGNKRVLSFLPKNPDSGPKP
ncbi:hypothetical protein J6590_106471, partial [Homalodisca vitripennis]